MRPFSLAVSLALGVCAVEAFPSFPHGGLPVREHSGAHHNITAHTRRTVPFDAKLQRIGVEGAHAFHPPGPGDQRGPCPGLNAMANHGYLPHNGVATISQFIDANVKVFGMGVDVATVLAVYGALQDGNLAKWSIGGPTPLVPSILGLPLGEPQGISGSHNKYESDVSPTRGDLYEYGNDYLLQLNQFQQLYDAGKAQDSYDIDLLHDFRYRRFEQSKSQNPYFFNAPFTGLIVQEAAYSFLFRFMGNKSAEYPEGRLDGEVLKSFFSITGEDGSFAYTPGHERIPYNWYTRNPADPYDLVAFNIDLLSAALKYPEFLSVGGNTGKPNTFTGVDIENLTGGVLNAGSLLQGNNLFCFAYEAGLQFLPDALSGLLTDPNAILAPLLNMLGSATSSLGCPQLNNINKAQFNQFPGYSRLNDDGEYQ